MTLVTHMPVAAAARLVGEHDTRLWRVIIHYVEAALARLDAIAPNLTSAKKIVVIGGHPDHESYEDWVAKHPADAC